MRVLFSTPYPTGSATGVGVLVARMAAYLRAQAGTAIIVEPGGPPAVPGLANLLLAVRSAGALFRHRAEVEVVHCQALHIQTLLVGLLGRILGKGVVLTVHGPSTRPRGRRRHIHSLIERWALLVPHRIAIVAAFLREQVGDRAVVVRNGVPVDEILSCRATREAMRRTLDLAEYVVVFVGRVTADKGVYTLLEAFREVHAARSGRMSLLLVGPPSDDVRAGIAEQYSNAPWLRLIDYTAEPWRFLAAADLFVLPSTREGLPLSLLEAMAIGLPAIASSVGGIPEVIEDRRTGRLVAAGDARALASALSEVVEAPGESLAMGKRASERVRAEFDLAAMCEAYSALYAEAMAAAG